MSQTKVLRKLFLGIAAAFSEAASEIEEVKTEAKTPTEGGKSGKSKEKEVAKETKVEKTKGKKKPVEVEDEETEEVESPYEAEESEEGESDEDGEESFEEEVEEDAGLISEGNLSKLKAALNKFSAAKGKPAAIKVLHKFAKTSTEVKEADFANIMKALKV